jgi:hypothetical protein
VEKHTKWFLINSATMGLIQFFTMLSVQALCMGGRVEILMNILAAFISSIIIFLIQVKSYSEIQMSEPDPPNNPGNPKPIENDCEPVKTHNPQKPPVIELRISEKPITCLQRKGKEIRGLLNIIPWW